MHMLEKLWNYERLQFGSQMYLPHGVGPGGKGKLSQAMG